MFIYTLILSTAIAVTINEQVYVNNGYYKFLPKYTLALEVKTRVPSKVTLEWICEVPDSQINSTTKKRTDFNRECVLVGCGKNIGPCDGNMMSVGCYREAAEKTAEALNTIEAGARNSVETYIKDTLNSVNTNTKRLLGAYEQTLYNNINGTRDNVAKVVTDGYAELSRSSNELINKVNGEVNNNLNNLMSYTNNEGTRLSNFNQETSSRLYGLQTTIRNGIIGIASRADLYYAKIIETDTEYATRFYDIADSIMKNFVSLDTYVEYLTETILVQRIRAKKNQAIHMQAGDVHGIISKYNEVYEYNKDYMFVDPPTYNYKYVTEGEKSMYNPYTGVTSTYDELFNGYYVITCEAFSFINRSYPTLPSMPIGLASSISCPVLTNFMVCENHTVSSDKVMDGSKLFASFTSCSLTESSKSCPMHKVVSSQDISGLKYTFITKDSTLNSTLTSISPGRMEWYTDGYNYVNKNIRAFSKYVPPKGSFYINVNGDGVVKIHKCYNGLVEFAHDNTPIETVDKTYKAIKQYPLRTALVKTYGITNVDKLALLVPENYVLNGTTYVFTVDRWCCSTISLEPTESVPEGEDPVKYCNMSNTYVCESKVIGSQTLHRSPLEYYCTDKNKHTSGFGILIEECKVSYLPLPGVGSYMEAMVTAPNGRGLATCLYWSNINGSVPAYEIHVNYADAIVPTLLLELDGTELIYGYDGSYVIDEVGDGSVGNRGYRCIDLNMDKSFHSPAICGNSEIPKYSITDYFSGNVRSTGLSRLLDAFKIIPVGYNENATIFYMDFYVREGVDLDSSYIEEENRCPIITYTISIANDRSKVCLYTGYQYELERGTLLYVNRNREGYVHVKLSSMYGDLVVGDGGSLEVKVYNPSPSIRANITCVRFDCYASQSMSISYPQVDNRFIIKRSSHFITLGGETLDEKYVESYISEHLNSMSALLNNFSSSIPDVAYLINNLNLKDIDLSESIKTFYEDVGNVYKQVQEIMSRAYHRLDDIKNISLEELKKAADEDVARANNITEDYLTRLNKIYDEAVDLNNTRKKSINFIFAVVSITSASILIVVSILVYCIMPMKRCFKKIKEGRKVLKEAASVNTQEMAEHVL